MRSHITITELARTTPSPANATLTVFGGNVPFWGVGTFAGARER